eukprot:evm.model.NODE_41581_length_36418_cov_47.844444.9
MEGAQSRKAHQDKDCLAEPVRHGGGEGGRDAIHGSRQLCCDRRARPDQDEAKYRVEEEEAPQDGGEAQHHAGTDGSGHMRGEEGGVPVYGQDVGVSEHGGRDPAEVEGEGEEEADGLGERGLGAQGLVQRQVEDEEGEEDAEHEQHGQGD